jgi:hypothetical protein
MGLNIQRPTATPHLIVHPINGQVISGQRRARIHCELFLLVAGELELDLSRPVIKDTKPPFWSADYRNKRSRK